MNRSARDLEHWLSRPLCCRYVLAEFKTLRLPIRDGAEVLDMSWRWALGLFKPGEYEVLGAWPAGAPSVDVAHDLHQRGLEHLTAVSADVGMDCASTFPDAVCWSSVGDPNITRVPPSGSFGPRRRAALRSAAATARRMQISINRAIKRRGPFADEAAAAAFLAQTLERADRRLYGT
ncbi:hypothetical protein [Roseateles sp.]|uniref:hypothetical protein n=1 Tax=Roseateles sp. TaxID=1971397 RepID=UPI00326775CE